MSSPIVTLTTDFGLQDHYVGTMKGVILARCPHVQLVDITHEIPPFSVLAGAYAVARAAGYFPPQTVHLVVVDPGVGGRRRALLAEVNDHFFVAPDNGVLSLIFDSGTVTRELTNPELWLPSPSSTFHGRDIFAPVAAALAGRTAKPTDVGPIIHDPVRLEDLLPRQIDNNRWQGIVLSTDRFGNVITNFPATRFQSRLERGFKLAAGWLEISTMRSTFSEAQPGECFGYIGSSGYLEIGRNQGDASLSLSLQTGDRIELRFAE